MLATEPLATDTSERGISVEEAKLTDWLLARGRKFHAHAVKLGRRMHCDSRPAALDEPAVLGFNVEGL